MKSKRISITKDFKSGLGPLGGVLSGMKWIKEKNKNYKWISTFPSDTPFFTKNELNFFYQHIIHCLQQTIQTCLSQQLDEIE